MDELRGLVMTTTGWEDGQFWDTPMETLKTMVEYWSNNPPVHVIEAVKAGIGKKGRQAPPPKEERKLEPYREMTDVEAAAELELPELVRKVREEKRQARKAAWQSQTQTK